jgi:hypothetical protein
MNVATLKMNERTGNFYQNKGGLWKTLTYPGMYMKTKDLSVYRPYVIEETCGYHNLKASPGSTLRSCNSTGRMSLSTG